MNVEVGFYHERIHVSEATLSRASYGIAGTRINRETGLSTSDQILQDLSRL